MGRTAPSPLVAAAVVLGLLLAGFAPSAGRAATRTSEAEKKNIEQYTELIRRDIRQEKRDLIAETMKMTPAEANAFWPIYERYEADLNRLGDEKLALINDYADNYKTMTDAKAGEITRKAVDLDIRRTSLLQQYLPEFQTALTSRRAAQFYQIEMPLLKLVDLQIAAQLPIMP